MNVVQTGEQSALQRHKQQLRETAAKDEARATELSRQGVDELFTSVERTDSAAKSHENAATLAKESQRLRRNGSEQSQRGLERLGDGSDRISESFAGTERGLQELKGSLTELEGASEEKSQGLQQAKQGLAEQGVENGLQGANLQKFSELNSKDAKLDGQKAEQLSELASNLALRQGGLERQSEQLDSYLIAGQSFAGGKAAKAEGFATLQSSSLNAVKAEALGDARDGKELTQTWAEADQSRHQQTSTDLKLSSLFQSFRAKAAALNADFHKGAAERQGQTAESTAAQAGELKGQAAELAQNARLLEQSGQCHVTLGRQMQCVPWTYCQGVQLERQGCAEIAEAQRMKGQAGEMRAEAQQLALQAEELRARAEDSQARGDEFEVKGHGSGTRSKLLQERATEHAADGDSAGRTASQAGEAASQLDAASQEARAVAERLQAQGTAKLQEGFVQQDEALHEQGAAADLLSGELVDERLLTEQSRETTGEALKTVAKELSFLGRGGRLLHNVGASHGREQKAQARVKDGVEALEAGLGLSETAQAKGVEATRLLEQARELELEGLRLQNRGQKMLLEARPKLAESARRSAESFEATQDAQRYEDEAAQLIQSGNEKIAAAAILRDKAANYKKLAE